MQTRKLDIFDADGTLVDPSPASLKEREYIFNSLDARLDATEKEDLLKDAERKTLEDPFRFPWMWEGRATAFTEDSYMWRNAQLELLWEHVQNGKDKATSLLDMFRYSTQDEKLELLPDTKVLVTRLLDEGHAVVIITNSSPFKAEKIADLLGVKDKIRVYGSAKKFVVGPNSPFEISGNTSYRDRPIYEGIINQVLLDYKIENPRNATVWFDMNTLDYSLPEVKGLRGMMRVNSQRDGFETPRPFIEYAMQIGLPALKTFK